MLGIFDGRRSKQSPALHFNTSANIVAALSGRNPALLYYYVAQTLKGLGFNGLGYKGRALAPAYARRR